jgi:hypothetical protein
LPRSARFGAGGPTDAFGLAEATRSGWSEAIMSNYAMTVLRVKRDVGHWGLPGARKALSTVLEALTLPPFSDGCELESGHFGFRRFRTLHSAVRGRLVW